ncbi:SMODS domain-containing nucleotidyltransferase [Rhodococcus jostii]|uniref:Nucleotidyltransferase n=1 Tax=Rhodococcus jostii TaxID=132919 RepID=A0ABU4CTT0_RHOJO|nr:nucleotidyltransferase [Rhodococcus jostii]MDV6286643.1 nucleotidyltransferase [Rhodococcus jostii]
MGIVQAFDDYQKTIDADHGQVKLARRRRDTFVSAFNSADDVTAVVKSGSLQRSTQLKPIHDVDIIAVFDSDRYPHWGQPGDSSEEALGRAHDIATELLGATSGTVERLIRRANPRNRAVKCFIDPPEQEKAFTVDVMPALRQSDGTLLLPSKRDREWSTADPEFLIACVAERQSESDYFRPLVRVLKDWRLDVPVDGKIKSLVMEVLALECLPTDSNRPHALRSFFTAAAVRVNYPIVDPAGHCGPIQPDVDVQGLRTALELAAENADLACTRAARNDLDGAKQAWREIFGPDFPAPAQRRVPAAPVVPPPIRDAPQG